MSDVQKLIKDLSNPSLEENGQISILSELFIKFFEPQNQPEICRGVIPIIMAKLTSVHTYEDEKGEKKFSVSEDLFEQYLLLIGAIANNSDLRVELVRKYQVIPTVVHCLNHPSVDFRDKVSATLTALTAGLPDAVVDVTKSGILPYLVELLSSKNEKDQISVLRVFSNLCAMNASAATMIMFHGGIPLILERLESTNPSVSIASLTAVARLVCSPTVRALISELLSQHVTQIKCLISMCSHSGINYALIACQTVAMLMMNPSNHYILRSLNALQALEAIFSRNPGQQLPTHFATAHWVRAHYILCQSPFWQVRCYLAFFYSRFCGRFGESVNSLHAETETLVHKEALCQIRMLAFDSEKSKIREFAKDALTHYKDELLQVMEVKSWAKFLEVDLSSKVLSEFEDQGLTMERLLSLELTIEDVKNALFASPSLSAGIRMALLASLINLRRQLSFDQHDSQQLIQSASTIAGPLEESKAPITNKPEEVKEPKQQTEKQQNTKAQSTDQLAKPDVFISYCWGNKPAAQRLRRLLENQGLSCWMDEIKIKPGEQLFREIDDGVSNCQVFLACLSPDYSRSENCRRELLLATERKKLVIPLQIASLDIWPPRGDLGPLLAGKVFINLSSEDKFEELQSQLVSAIKQSLAN